MQEYTLKLLYSGSTGNAALLKSGDTAILIDAGRSAKALTAALKEAGVDPDEIRAIFLTHEHQDHTSALDIFLKKRTVPVHITAPSAEKLCRCGSNCFLPPAVRYRSLVICPVSGRAAGVWSAVKCAAVIPSMTGPNIRNRSPHAVLR